MNVSKDSIIAGIITFIGIFLVILVGWLVIDEVKYNYIGVCDHKFGEGNWVSVINNNSDYELNVEYTCVNKSSGLNDGLVFTTG